MSFLYGLIGVLCGVILILIGVMAGYQIYPIKHPTVTADAPEPSAEELRRMKEEQEALAILQNYSVEQAYGIRGYSNREEGEPK